MIDLIYFIFLAFIIFQGLFTLYLTLYVWEDPEMLDKMASPKKFLDPKKSFTVIIPAKHEQKVIGQTIRSLSHTNYPKSLVEIIIVCEENDIKTIQAIKKAVTQFRIENVKIITFIDAPTNKPHALNKGLSIAKNEIISIFDAEDEVSKDIFNVANTLFLTKKPDIIQAGVQLMNYASKWFSVHNTLEYYFWFKSRMHFHTKIGVVPLGGNTVFFKTQHLREIGGWNEACLTEDAEIGIRLSVKGAKIISTYDPLHITKEETPGTMSQFIKQRTRWNQGFIQILRKGLWKDYNSFIKRAFCLYVLSFPIVQTIVFISTPISIYFGFFGKLPIWLSLLSFMPLAIILLQYVINVIALHEFIKEQKLDNQPLVYILMPFTLIPYQFLLGVAAMRASFRELLGHTNWEKTNHPGLHRNLYDNLNFNADLA